MIRISASAEHVKNRESSGRVVRVFCIGSNHSRDFICLSAAKVIILGWTSTGGMTVVSDDSGNGFHSDF